MEKLYRILRYVEPYSNRVTEVKRGLTHSQAQEWIQVQEEPKRFIIVPEYI